MYLHRTAIVAVFALTSLAPGFCQTHLETTQGSATSADLGPRGQYAISRLVGREETRFHAIESEQGLRFENALRGVSARFDAMGATIRATTLSLGLRLESIGYGDALEPVRPAALSCRDNRVELGRGDLCEWYVNGPLGLQQGFTLNQAPTGSRSGELTLSIGLEGDLVPVLHEDGRGLSFRDPSGSATMRYSGLVAYDSCGRALDARLELGDHSLLIRVDDAGARYPLVIDPLIESKLTTTDNTAGDQLGSDIAISGDVVVAGASGDGADTGAAYVFVKPAAGWSSMTEAAKLLASDGAANSLFGNSVAIDGDTIVVGAKRHNSLAGANYVFVKPAGGWAGTLFETAILTGTDAAPGMQRSECSVSGDTVVVGGSPPALLFVKPGGGWVSMTETATLVASDNPTKTITAVSIAGNTIVAGYQIADSLAGIGTGAAYVFERPVGGWAGAVTESAKLYATTLSSSDFFGQSVGFDGVTVVVGAMLDDDNGTNAGTAWVFEEPVGGWSGTLTETARLTPSAGIVGSVFGVSVDVLGDTIVVGRPGLSPSPLTGSVFVFEKPVGGWVGMTETLEISASDGNIGDLLGFSVAVQGGNFVSGAIFDDDNGTDSGTVYIWRTSSAAAPSDILLADFNADGTLDTLTANSGSDTVTLRGNDGTGSYGAGTNTALTAGDKPVAVAWGDLVAGGGTDVAVACQDSHVVRILSNFPVGSLSVNSSISLSSIGATPVDVSVGDLDGAGTDDLAIALEGELIIAGRSGVAVSLNGGAATMLTAPASGFGSIKGCAICDLDGDGDGDVICSMSASLFVPAVKNLLLYENDGAGNFGAPVVLTTTEEPRQICCFDIDGDQDLDLLVTTQNLLSAGALQILLNDGLAAGSWAAGSFSDGGSYPGGGGPLGIACGDLGDENIPGFYARNDVVVTNLISGDVTRHKGFVDPVSGFESTVTIAAGSVPMAAAIGELNGDKTLDIVIVNIGSADVTVVLTNPLAQARAFGTGCPGTAGKVPAVGTNGLPVAGSSTFDLTLSNARPLSGALLGLSLTQTTTPLTGGCVLYLSGFSLIGPILTDSSGAITLGLPVPGPASAFFGCEAFFQFFVSDPQGAFQGQWAFSDALRIKVAN